MHKRFSLFVLLAMAFKVAETGGTTPAVYNAANEVAVDMFLKETIEFRAIPDIIVNTIDKHQPVEKPSLDEILEADQWARDCVREMTR